MLINIELWSIDNKTPITYSKAKNLTFNIG